MICRIYCAGNTTSSAIVRDNPDTFGTGKVFDRYAQQVNRTVRHDGNQRYNAEDDLTYEPLLPIPRTIDAYMKRQW